MVYPCHQLVVITDLSTGEQRFLMGHTAKVTKEEEEGGERVGRREGGREKEDVVTILCLLQVSCLAVNGEGSLIASGQAGSSAVVRVWEHETGRCLSLFQSHSHSLRCLR